jgi:hypothetical protein
MTAAAGARCRRYVALRVAGDDAYRVADDFGWFRANIDNVADFVLRWPANDIGLQGPSCGSPPASSRTGQTVDLLVEQVDADPDRIRRVLHRDDESEAPIAGLQGGVGQDRAIGSNDAASSGVEDWIVLEQDTGFDGRFDRTSTCFEDGSADFYRRLEIGSALGSGSGSAVCYNRWSCHSNSPPLGARLGI